MNDSSHSHLHLFQMILQNPIQPGFFSIICEVNCHKDAIYFLLMSMVYYLDQKSWSSGTPSSFGEYLSSAVAALSFLR